VRPLDLGYQQFLEICDPLEDLLLEHSTPTEFRDLLIDRLRTRSPDLARKVEAFDTQQIHFLWKQVVEHQKLVKWMND
jgi:hypothetical protein